MGALPSFSPELPDFRLLRIADLAESTAELPRRGTTPAAEPAAVPNPST
jgi:hypothetical protein